MEQVLGSQASVTGCAEVEVWAGKDKGIPVKLRPNGAISGPAQCEGSHEEVTEKHRSTVEQ